MKSRFELGEREQLLGVKVSAQSRLTMRNSHFLSLSNSGSEFPLIFYNLSASVNCRVNRNVEINRWRYGAGVEKRKVGVFVHL